MTLPRWLIWTVVTVLSWGIWAIIGKLIGDQVSPAHCQILSTVGLLPIIVILGWRWGKRGVSEPPSNLQQPRSGIAFAFLSGIVSSVGNVPYYHLLSSGEHAVSAVAITSMAPMVTVLLAVVFLQESLSRIQSIGIGLALFAIYLFNVSSKNEVISTWLLIALIPIGLWGLTGFLQKLATNHITGRQSAFWFLVAFVPVACLLAVWDFPKLQLTAYLWLLNALLGFTLAFGNWTILMAFDSGGQASIVSPMASLYPLVSVPIAILAFGEMVSGRQWLGIVCAMMAVVAIARESTQTSSTQ